MESQKKNWEMEINIFVKGGGELGFINNKREAEGSIRFLQTAHGLVWTYMVDNCYFGLL